MTALRAASALVLVTAFLGNLIRIPLFAAAEKTAPLLPLDLAVMALLCVGALEAIRQRRLALDRPSLWGLAFVGFALIGLVTAGPRFGLALPQVLFAGAYLARWSVYFALFVFAGALLGEEDAPFLIALFRRGLLLFAAFGIVQAVLLPDFALLVYSEARRYLDWDPQGHRLVSSFLDPNYAGCLLVVGLSLWGGRLLAGAPSRWSEGFVLVLALTLTLSRGSLLAAAGAAVAIVLAHGVSVRVMRAGGAVSIAFVLASPFVLRYALKLGRFTIDPSALDRLLSWKRALILIGDHPILGVGFNTVGFIASRYGWTKLGNSSFGLDGGLLFIAALTGLVGLALFIALLGSIIASARTSWRDRRVSAEERGVAYAVAGSVVGVTIHASFTNAFLLPLLLAPCFLLWSMPRVFRRADPSGASPRAQ